MDNRVIEGRKMYHLDEKQIQEITDYIFLEDKLEKADAIFIPGCARPEHTEEAARLYKDGYAPLLLPSGGYTKVQGSFQGVSKEGQKYGADFACEADFLEAVLIQNGVPASAILKECEATYTLENAEKTIFCLVSMSMVPFWVRTDTTLPSSARSEALTQARGIFFL